MGEVSNRFLSSRSGDEEEGLSFEERTERKGWATLSLQSPVELSLEADGPMQAQPQLKCRRSPA